MHLPREESAMGRNCQAIVSPLSAVLSHWQGLPGAEHSLDSNAAADPKGLVAGSLEIPWLLHLQWKLHKLAIWFIKQSHVTLIIVYLSVRMGSFQSPVPRAVRLKIRPTP